MTPIDYTDALDANWRIFPLHDINYAEGRQFCGCGHEDCEAIGKHPRAGNWQITPVWDEDQLSYLEDEDELFFGNQLIDGYGIVVNTSGLIVVDVDGRNGGFESADKLAEIREKCGFIVESGSCNGEHWYFALPESDDNYLTNHKDYAGIDFKTTGYVVGCGSEHKSGERYSVLKGSPNELTQAPVQLLDLLKRTKRADGFSTRPECSLTELADIVKAIKNDDRDYEKFIRVGMGIHDATEGSDEGYNLWLTWSEQSDAHNDAQMPMKWHSFGKTASPVTLATLTQWAKDDGYSEPVTFEDNTDWGDIDEIPQEAPKPKPKSANEIDLKKPPNLVGELTDWINSRSIFPREHLAVAAALQIVSNVAGMRYIVDGLNTNINLMTFGIAGSRTGKGKILECVTECHAAVGLSGAVHGIVKSEQEIIRNAIRNQAIFYVYDEFGSMLTKLCNARKKGSTPYLEGVLSTIMAIYSAANSNFNISGDAKEEMSELAQKKVLKAQKVLDDGKAELGNKLMDAALAELDRAEGGIYQPYLTFFGLSEPASFNDAINLDPWVLTGGFLGRALIFEEIETVPKRKDMADISKAELPLNLKAKLMALYTGGNSQDENKGRIERQGEQEIIKMDDEASAFLAMMYDYWDEVARLERDNGSQLESQALGATEIAIKLAGVLAADTQLITKKEIEWSHAMVKKVTLMKISKAKSTKNMESKDSKEKGEGLLESITTTLQNSDKPLAMGTIRNRCGRNITKDNVQEALDYMLSKGLISSETTKAGNGRKFTYYSLN